VAGVEGGVRYLWLLRQWRSLEGSGSQLAGRAKDGPTLFIIARNSSVVGMCKMIFKVY